MAADHALLTAEAQYFAMQGVEQALEVIELARDSLNPDLSWLGVVLNLADMRTIHSREAYQSLAEAFGDKVFETTIRQSIAYAESAERAVSILDHRPDLGADYLALAERAARAARPARGARSDSARSSSPDDETRGRGRSPSWRWPASAAAVRRRGAVGERRRAADRVPVTPTPPPRRAAAGAHRGAGQAEAAAARACPPACPACGTLTAYVTRAKVLRAPPGRARGWP